MRLRVLGPMRLEGGEGQVLEIKAKKSRALLAYLALHPRHGESRERLAGLLWGGMGEDRARANLRQSISDIREILATAGAGDATVAGRILVAEGDQVRIDVEALRVDALDLRRLAASNRPDEWRVAAELYQGDLLADLATGEEPFEDWLAAERRDLRALACSLWSRLAASLCAARDDAAAEGALVCWLALDGASEEAHRALMQLYQDTGRRARALAQFELCKAALARAFGVEPDASTAALVRTIAEAPPPPRAALPLPARPSIAVLPFAISSADEAWLGDGMAEDIIVALSKFERLLVIARQSSFVFRDRDADVREIGRALGVHYVLSGTVRRGNERTRLALSLADAETGLTTWAQTYDVPAAEVLDAQQDIVQVLVATLAGRVEADRVARSRRGPLTSLEAYDCLLRGKLHHHRFTAEDNVAARACLERALELDPELALAHAWMACVLAQGFSFRGPDATSVGACYRHLQRAVTLQEDDSECHRVLASYYLVYKRHDDAIRHQARALALNPNDDRIVCQEGELLTYLGRAREGIPWIERAMRLNPYHADGYFNDLGRALYHAGEAAAARRQWTSIRAPRGVHFAYLAASSARLGERALAQAYVGNALACDASLTPERFVDSLPYRTIAARTTLVEDLRSAWGAGS
jgi:TolB-like protein